MTVVEDFFHLGLQLYEKRKKFLLNKREMELLKLENKGRFILAVVKGEIIVSNRKRADLYVELQTKGFSPFPKKAKAVEPEVAVATDDTEETEVKSPADSSSNGVQGQVDFDDKSSWEYLFKDYWIDLKERLSLTLDEVNQAKSPWKGGSDVPTGKQESPDELYDAYNDERSAAVVMGYRLVIMSIYWPWQLEA